ncbi:hypothetical protein ACOME3_003408 [Neoechinorhynchus agilis]
MDNRWHVEHLSCWWCDKTLAGNKMIMKDDRTYCVDCFGENFCHNCEKCKIRIGADMKNIAYQNKHWHGTCFYCIRCDKSLIGQPFVFHVDSLCCTECFNEHYAARCFKCKKIFEPGVKKLSYKGNQYHENCFLCDFCENPVACASFLIKDGKVCCTLCNEELFATKCHRCGKIIETGGVAFRELPFHRECFRCKECDCNLSKIKFFSRDGEAYCNNCYLTKFSERCFACKDLITSSGTGKYINFNGKNWHSKCFICSKCKDVLANKKFILEGDNIVCPKCG